MHIGCDDHDGGVGLCGVSKDTSSKPGKPVTADFKLRKSRLYHWTLGSDNDD